MQMKRFLPTFSLLLLLWSLSPGVCRAETSEADSVASDHSMGEVVVTATRTRKLLKDTPILTRVVNRKDIEMADATDLRDLLQQELPGVEFTYSMNQKLNMNMSGFAGQSVLILVDGERLAGETMENVDFSRIDMNNVERIEIVRGAQSALYGAGAVGGVINIITRGASRPWSLNLNGRLADHREQRYGGVLGLSKGRVGNMLDVQYTSVDNYTVCMDYADECQFRNVYGGRTWNVKDKFTYRPTDALRLTARAGYYFKELTTDADVYERFRDFSGGLRAEWDITGKDHLEVSLSYDQYDKSDLLRLWERDVMDYRNLQMSVRTMYNRTFRQKDILTVGGDYMRDYLHTYQFSDGKERVQYTGDLFAQYDCFLGKRWELIGAGRWDYFSDAKGASQLTGKLAARYTFDSFILRAGYAGGFRAPTLKEKYSYFNMVGDIYVKGNEALEAERSHNFNLSAEYSWQNYNFSASASYNTIANRITSSAPQQGTMGEYYVQYINLPLARVLGVELAGWAQTQGQGKLCLHPRVGKPGRCHTILPCPSPFVQPAHGLGQAMDLFLRNHPFRPWPCALGRGLRDYTDGLSLHSPPGTQSCLHHLEGTVAEPSGQGHKVQHSRGQCLQLLPRGVLLQLSRHLGHQPHGRHQRGCGQTLVNGNRKS